MKINTAIAVPCLVLLVIAVWIHASDDLVRAAFGRRDLLWIATVVAMSVAVRGIPERMTRGRRAILGVLAFAACTGVWALFATGIGASLLSGSGIAPYYAALTGLIATGVCVAVALPAAGSSASAQQSVLPRIVLIVLAILSPVAYGHAVAESSRSRLVEALQSGRIALAHQLASVVRVIHPRTTVMDLSLPDLMQALDEERRQLTARLETPTPIRSTAAEIGQRATILMQLDRNREALDLLEPLTADAAKAPVALDYCGLCCQRLGDWTSSRNWYDRSRQFWIKQPESPRRNQALVSAYQGIAFAERRLNHPLVAEQAYKDSLALIKSADTHFLLALHYEEQQQTKLAEQHARSAAILAPEVYSQRVRQLLDQMALTHLGCSNVTVSRSSGARPSGDH